MLLKIGINKYFSPHFVMIINGKRMFQCLFSEEDRTKAYLWMEGYIEGLGNPNIQFDDRNDNDNDLPLLIMW